MKIKRLIKDANYINVKKGKFELVNIYFSTDQTGKQQVTLSKSNKLGQFTDGTVIHDLGGSYVAPAFCDIRCNIGDISPKNTSPDVKCAKESGYGIICPTPTEDRNFPVNSHLFKDYRQKLSKIHNPLVLPVAPIIQTVYGAEKAGDIKNLIYEGVGLFTDRSPSGYISTSILRNVMLEIAKGDGLLICSCPDLSIVGKGVVNQGYSHPSLPSYEGISPSAELLFVSRSIILSWETGCRIHISGISLGESVKMIGRAKQDGVRVSCSVAPPYFCYKEDDLFYRGAMAKLMPPLRKRSDVIAIIQGLADGTVDCIESDHMPISTSSKMDIKSGAFGSTSFETAFSAGLTYLVRKNMLSIFRLIELMSIKPYEIIFNKQFEDSDLFSTGIIKLDTVNGNIYSQQTSMLSKRASVFDGAFLYGKAGIIT